MKNQRLAAGVVLVSLAGFAATAHLAAQVGYEFLSLVALLR